MSASYSSQHDVGQGRNRLQESASNNISSNGEQVLETYHELDRRDNIDPSMHNVTVERDFGTWLL